MSNWAPKPLRPLGAPGQVSQIIEKSVVSKERNPMQVQRDKDGSPYTRYGHTRLRPEQPALMVGDAVSKAIDAKECEDEKKDPTEILKSYFEFHGITV